MKWRRPTRVDRIILALAGVFLVFLAVATTSLLWSTRQTSLAESRTQTTRFVNGASVALNRNLLGVDVLLANLDDLLGLSGLVADWIDPVLASRTLNGAAQQNLMLSNLSLLNAQGQVLATSDPSGKSLVLSLPPGYLDMVLGQPVSTLIVSSPTVSFTSTEPVLYLARYLRLADATRVVALAELPLALLTSIMIQGADISGLEVTLERANGELLASMPIQRTPPPKRLAQPLGHALTDSGPRSLPARLTGQDAIVVSRPILYRDILVAASLPTGAALSQWRAQQKFVLAAAGAFALMILVAAGFAIDYVARLSKARRSLIESKAEIEKLAFFDPLTGLPNRRLLMNRLQKSVSGNTRSHHHGALLFMDLDRFKTLNDTLGHDVGDDLLMQVGKRLIDSVREKDTVARLGGDEFVILLEDLSQDSQMAMTAARHVGNKVLLRFSEPFQLGIHEHHCTSSIGATVFAANALAPVDLLKQADIAMYQVKSQGRNGLCFFDPKMQADITARAQLERDLRVALAEGQFELHYQPQFQLFGHVVGAEVLIRWRHPQRGLVSPLEFIPIAEESQLILEIGRWVMQTVCQQLALWQRDPLRKFLQLSVNVSARQFRQPTFVAEVNAIMNEHGIAPHLLTLELTESLVLDNVDATVIKMTELKARGVQFSVDDFGTGHSSLSYLTRLPLDQLKIDQSFVRNIGIQTSDGVMVQTIIGMARNLGLEVIAEGVETVQQQEFLALHGCNLYQGYLFGRPTPLREFDALVQTSSIAHASEGGLRNAS